MPLSDVGINGRVVRTPDRVKVPHELSRALETAACRFYDGVVDGPNVSVSVTPGVAAS